MDSLGAKRLKQVSLTRAELSQHLGETLLFMQRLWDLVHALEVRSRRMAKVLGVTGPQRLVIRVLGRAPASTASGIAGILGLHPSTLTGVLKRLEEQGMIGRAIEEIGPEGLLLVVSGYGMEPLSLGKRIIERMIGDPEVNGTHESAPDGFLMAYGASVTSRRLPRASVVDVVPTLLYFLGLPIGRDMDGFARTDVFRRDFTEGRPLTFIPTYDR